LKPDALQYEWDFGDGSKSKLASPQHFFQKPGIYVITMTAINPENRANIATKKLVLTIRPVVPRIEAGGKTAARD
jgi:PKD repeat protein